MCRAAIRTGHAAIHRTACRSPAHLSPRLPNHLKHTHIIGTFPLETDPPDATAQTSIALAVDTRMRRLYVLYDHASGTDPKSPGAVWVMDTGNGHVRRIVAVGHAPSALLADPLTGCVFVANAGDNTVSVLEAAHL